jgi:hypothetical protein
MWIASCVATAYIMRYGRLKAGGGPDDGADVVPLSPSIGLGEGAVIFGDGDGALVTGGGSIEECDVGGFDGIMGSGRASISSSCEVSMVICFVGCAVWRIV